MLHTWEHSERQYSRGRKPSWKTMSAGPLRTLKELCVPRVHVATHLRVQFSAAGDTGRSMRKGCSGAHFRRGAACQGVANVAPGGSAGVSHARRALARARAWAGRAHLRSIISAQRLRHIFPLVFHRRPARRARRIELSVCRAAGRADRATAAHRAAHDGIRGRNRPERK